MEGTELVLVYNNPKGEAFKHYFDYIRKNYTDREFTRSDMPKVKRRYLNEVKKLTRGTNWISSSPEIAAAEEILADICNNGLLKSRDVMTNEYGDKDIFFFLTEKGMKSKVEFG